jgi:hypothetical protein
LQALVLRIDEAGAKADLMGSGPGLKVVEVNVPQSLLHPGYDYLPELFRWYMEAAPVR